MTLKVSDNTPHTKQQALDKLDYICSRYGITDSDALREDLRRIHGLLTGEIPEFERDFSRYIVIKTKDLTEKQQDQLCDFLRGHGVRTRKSIVIEEGWPEYEPTWNLVADRVQSEQIQDRASGLE